MKKNTLEKAYKVIDDILEETCLSEEFVIQAICSLLERENIKFSSLIVTEIISILSQWNKIPVIETKIKIEKLHARFKINVDK